MLLHTIIALPVQNTLTYCQSDRFAVQLFRRSSVVRKISSKEVLGLLKHLGEHHNILRICEGRKPHCSNVVGVCFNFAQVLLRKVRCFNNFEYFKSLHNIYGPFLIWYIVTQSWPCKPGTLSRICTHYHMHDTYVIIRNNEFIITSHNT